MHEAKNQEWQAGWTVPITTSRDMPVAEFERYRTVNQAVLDYARQHRLTRADISARSGIAAGTLYDLLKGTYRGLYKGFVEQLENWLKAEAEAALQRQVRVEVPAFVETPTAREVLNALVYAQTAPAFVLVTLGPGMGKTTCARHMAETRPGVFRTVMRPSIQRPGAMMTEIARVLEISERNANRRAVEVGIRLKRNGRHTLLIVDEAQFLSDEAVNELRYLMDEYGVGIALLGNEDLNARYGGVRPKEGYGQLHRRIGMRVRRLHPQAGDIEAYVAAWNFGDADIIRMLKAIASRSGALGQVAETVKLAAVLSGDSGQLTAEAIRVAWRNRGGENL